MLLCWTDEAPLVRISYQDLKKTPKPGDLGRRLPWKSRRRWGSLPAPASTPTRAFGLPGMPRGRRCGNDPATAALPEKQPPLPGRRRLRRQVRTCWGHFSSIRPWQRLNGAREGASPPPRAARVHRWQPRAQLPGGCTESQSTQCSQRPRLGRARHTCAAQMVSPAAAGTRNPAEDAYAGATPGVSDLGGRRPRPARSLHLASLRPPRPPATNMSLHKVGPVLGSS